MRTIIEEVTADELIEMFNNSLDEKIKPILRFVESTDKIIVTRKTAAEILKVTPRTLNNYVEKKMLTPVFKKTGKQVEYRLSEIIALKNVNVRKN